MTAIPATKGNGDEDDEVIHGYVRQVKDRIAGLIEHGIPLRGGEG